ncbi:RidA family protein [Variovorax sp. LT1R20]|uniref:RidA family protein n=1 Tax=Variovorax sp. LT1R20 TaxID=3443729 RepID=UPI003F460F52
MSDHPSDTGTVAYVDPESLAAPGGHYSHVSVANGLAFVSGQLPITPAGLKLVDASFEDQARQVLANVQTALEAASSGVHHLVQVRVYVDSMENWPAFNAVYREWAGTIRPSRAVVPTGPLHFGLKVEVEAIGRVADPPTAREKT